MKMENSCKREEKKKERRKEKKKEKEKGIERKKKGEEEKREKKVEGEREGGKETKGYPSVPFSFLIHSHSFYFLLLPSYSPLFLFLNRSFLFLIFFLFSLFSSPLISSPLLLHSFSLSFLFYTHPPSSSLVFPLFSFLHSSPFFSAPLFLFLSSFSPVPLSRFFLFLFSSFFHKSIYTIPFLSFVFFFYIFYLD